MQKLSSTLVEELRQRLDPTPCGLVRKLVEAGHEAYIVGGAVRDLLLGNTPKDYDIATSATPEEIRHVFGRRRCHIIGRRFRLVHVYANGEPYEVSTFRRVPSERERQGRHPDAEDHIIWNDNSFGTLEDDATRRDFTANALYFDVVGQRGIIDFGNGYQDLQNRVVRCIGKPDERMEEDPVRMLRALKLVGQFGFRLEPELDAVIRRQAADIRLASPSRLFEELLKILKHPAADQTLLEMHNHGFLKYFWNLLDAAWDEQEGQLARHLLKLRGEAIRRGRYSNSRGLALATVATPFILTAMNPEKPTDFWMGSLSYNPIAQRALQLIFEDFQLPNLLARRILTIVGLVPRLMNFNTAAGREKLLRNAEYRYGRALLALLVQAFGWDAAKLLGELPEISPLYDGWDADEDEQDRQKDLPEQEPIATPKAAAVPAAPAPQLPPAEPREAATQQVSRSSQPKRRNKNKGTHLQAVTTSETEHPVDDGQAAMPEPNPHEAKPVVEKPNRRPDNETRLEDAQPQEARLVALRKDGLRVKLPKTIGAEKDKPIGKVEFGTSFVATPDRKRRPATEVETITFSPNSTPSHRRKRPVAGGKAGEFKA